MFSKPEHEMDLTERWIRRFALQNRQWSTCWYDRYPEIERHMFEFQIRALRGDRAGAIAEHAAWIEAQAGRIRTITSPGDRKRRCSPTSTGATAGVTRPSSPRRKRLKTKRQNSSASPRPACRRRCATFITARPRSLVPSERKRNSPSMPAKPDGLVSVSAREALRALRARQCRDQRDRVIGERCGAHRLAAELGAVAAGESCGSPTDRARHRDRPAAPGSRTPADCPTDRCRAAGCCANSSPRRSAHPRSPPPNSPSSAINSASAWPSDCATVRAGGRTIGAVFLERDDAAALARRPPA